MLIPGTWCSLRSFSTNASNPPSKRLNVDGSEPLLSTIPSTGSEELIADVADEDVNVENVGPGVAQRQER